MLRTMRKSSRNLLHLLNICLLVCLVTSLPYNKGKRETTENKDAPVKYCHRSMPCAWAVYVPFTRTIDHFIYNTCQCRKHQECLNTEDDLSVSAYVYMCRTPSTTEKQPVKQ